MMGPEGYEFVPLPREVNREQRPHAVFDRRVRDAMWVMLEVEYVALEPIHIGSGFRVLHGQRAVRAAARSGDRLVIPGSSMKGVLRARYEAITRSCALHQAPKGQKLGPQLPSCSYPGYEVEFGSAVRQHPAFKACDAQLLCSACALFGRMSLRSRVSVHDLRAPAGTTSVDREIPKRYSPRPHHLGRYSQDRSAAVLRVHELHGRKFHVGGAPQPEVAGDLAEVIKVGTTLSGTITCSNVSLAELGGLLSALGAHPVSSLKLGSAKAYRFGRIELTKNLRVDVKRPERFDEEGFFERVRQAFETSKDYWPEGERALVAMHRRRAS
jgi:hypothetical protein